MFIFLLLACTIAALIILLRCKVPLGPAILLCGLGLWLVQKPEVSLLINSAKTMLLGLCISLSAWKLNSEKADALPAW